LLPTLARVDFKKERLMSRIVWIWVYMAVLISTISSLGVVFSLKSKE